MWLEATYIFLPAWQISAFHFLLALYQDTPEKMLDGALRALCWVPARTAALTAGSPSSVYLWSTARAASASSLYNPMCLKEE